ncbi:MAG: hypothetical protein IPK03_03310 [Bacteroidetes bacterium]|nr:hypothetical protein [Bacteroidota bacterium]
MKTNLLFLVLTIVFISCSKDEDPLKPAKCKINTIRYTDSKGRIDILNYSYNNDGELLPAINSNVGYPEKSFGKELGLGWFLSSGNLKFDDNGYLKSITTYNYSYTYDNVKQVIITDSTIDKIYIVKLKMKNLFVKDPKTGLEIFEYYSDKASQVLYPENLRYGKPSKNLIKRNGDFNYTYNYNDNGCISKIFCNTSSGSYSKSFEVTYE